jgi:6-pyruvoyltetrahydropterin/6-carboxytetrahydropterin synthase
MNLNLDVDFLKGKNPTTEILAMEFWKILAPMIKEHGAELHCILLAETTKNSIEYYGE